MPTRNARSCRMPGGNARRCPACREMRTAGGAAWDAPTFRWLFDAPDSELLNQVYPSVPDAVGASTASVAAALTALGLSANECADLATATVEIACLKISCS